ncbi:MAG TPA: PmoA family protein, partial [Clostridiales bacterium]|nr:PmoA family protein [Clostridiales bacterium]
MSIRLEQKGMDVDVFIDDRLFTTCVNNPDFKAPFMGPVYTSHGQSFTRPETRHREHPHQRSVFIGIGDINRYDFWNEHAVPLGLIRVIGVDLNKDENLVKTTALWQGRRGKKFLDEERTYKFIKISDKAVRVDLSLKLTANYMDIRVGKTKEAGPLGIRVADGLRVDSGGRFENSEGGVNEEGCWGKTAAWCNYYGLLDGKKV